MDILGKQGVSMAGGGSFVGDLLGSLAALAAPQLNE